MILVHEQPWQRYFHRNNPIRCSEHTCSVGADGERHGIAAPTTRHAEDDQHQSEGRHDLTQPQVLLRRWVDRLTAGSENVGARDGADGQCR